jgi:predicted ATPase/serine phosphatase RsbU (regulator of sigma subunit)
MKTNEFEVIYTGENSIIYRASHSEYSSVAVKMLRSENPPFSQLQHITNEFEIGADNIEGVRKILELTKVDNKPALVLELVDGSSIKKNLSKFSTNIDYTLEIGVKIADALNNLHDNGIIHKDLNSNNILITNENKIKIIDLGISSKYDSKNKNASNPSKLEGTLEYISPEQTGRMNRKVDQSSDLYSLGVVLFEMLCGELPFESIDPFELVHFHIAQKPKSPTSIKKDIPNALSQVVLKLLSKNAEDRYKSALGLKRDLEFILNALPQLEKLSDFKPGQSDFSSELIIPEKLYGRDKEIEELTERFDRVLAGSVELVYVEGRAGVGKSALIHELQPTFSDKNSIYLEGKFERFDKEIPYSALSKAFNSFLEIVLNETDENLAYWKNRIQSALGNLGQVITAVFPNLEALIGPQEDVPELDSDEAKNRFNLVWTKLLNGIGTADHPLVLFLDDLQWADSSSVELLRNILNDQTGSHLLCIASMRPLDESGVLPIQLITETEGWVSKIVLQNLSKNHIEEIVRTALDVNKNKKLDKSSVQELAEMLYLKTSGNVFFVTQLLESLFSQGLIEFDKSDNIWTWDITQIREQKITNNVIDLLTESLLKLPKDCLKLLQTISGKGNSFTMDFLSEIENDSDTSVRKILEPAIKERILVRENHNLYRFIHDRVLSAVYETIDEDAKKKLHLKIGRYLKEKSGTDKNEIFEITNHFQKAIDIIDESEKDDLFYLNFISGKRAMKSVAYEAANSYFSTAIELKGPAFWNKDYELCLDLHNAALNPALSIGQFEQTEDICSIIIDNAKDKLDKSVAYLAQLNARVAQGKYIEANDLGLNILSQFGIKIPKEPKMFHVGLYLMKAKSALRGKDTKDILELPKMVDKEMIAVMQFLDPLVTSTYLTSLNLNLAITLTGFIQTLKYGLSKKSAYYLTSYGGVMAYLNNFDKSYAFGQTALELVQRNNPSAYYGREYTIALLFTIPFKKRISSIYSDFMKIYENCIERGDLETAGWGLTNYHFYKYYSNGNLSELLEEHSKDIETFNKINNDYSNIRFKSLIQFANDLVHHNISVSNSSKDRVESQSGEIYFSASEIQDLLDSKDLGNIGYYLSYAIHRNYLQRNFEEAIQLIDKIQPSLTGISGTYILSIYYLYSCLSILSAPKNSATKYEGLLKKNKKKLLVWANACPENYQHKYDIVEALMNQKQGKMSLAKDLFEKAIIGARENEFISDEAIAWELGGELFEEASVHFQAEFYFQNAHRCYKDWGAEANVKRLEDKYPSYNFDSQYMSGQTTHITSSVSSGITFNQNMDLNSVIKASQSISQEVKQEGLLRSLMLTIMENAGAENGLFLQNNSGKLTIEADCSITRKENIFLGGFDTSKFNCPQGLVRYVLRTKKELVLNDAIKDDTYGYDEYIKANNVRSILCFPVVHKNNVTAIIYLENNLVSHAFTNDNLDTVRLLSSQIAISLENATLYQNLENKVEDRTRELNHAHNEIKDSILYAKRIQTAILPQPSFLADKFKNGFVLFKPKDVVSGDFFWFKEIDNTLIFAAADCTGHGVPGAMVSVICNAALNRSVREFGIVDPGAILDKTKELVIEVFEKSEEKVQDGMDISISAINLKTNELKWAGANNSIYCIQKIKDDTSVDALKSDTHFLHEVKPNVQPVGIYATNKPFTTHSINVEEGDMIYMYTDGYADQFGGPRGKKLKTKNFKRILLDNCHLDPSKQRKILDREFEKWRGEEEQIDDVCVIGLKI